LLEESIDESDVIVDVDAVRMLVAAQHAVVVCLDAGPILHASLVPVARHLRPQVVDRVEPVAVSVVAPGADRYAG
jgi:hypothetical protein